MLKKLLNISIFIALSTGLFAQADYPGEATRTPMGKALQKLRWDMNLGTAFTYMPGYGGGMSYFAAPGFSYPVNNRFSFHGGMVAGIFTSPGMSNADGAPEKVSSGYTSFYGTAAYHLNQNVVFYATGVKSIHTFGRMNPFFSPSYDEISFGSSIRLGNNVTIGASVHFREYSPMSGPYYSPFFE